MIHPVIRIFIFLVFAGLISLLDMTGLILAGTALVVLYLLINPEYFRSAWKMITRMRWFFLSIAVIFFWFTPGQPLLFHLLPFSADWLPTRQGVEAGMLRVVSLMLIIMAVNLLLRTSTQDQLLSSIHWLARPLSWLGVSPDRLAVRMVLVMDSLTEVQKMVRQMLAAMQDEARSLRRIGHFSSDIFTRVTVQAEEAPCRTIELAGCSAPPVYQWLYPLLLGSLLYFI